MQLTRSYLCGGLQSSGSTLVSWCFLQRRDMDGVLDARFDTLPPLPMHFDGKLSWCKFTVACFRFTEVLSYFDDEQFSVRPLLVVRDARAVFNSLISKTYGRNGTTADDPPIRLRLRRFLNDWHHFRQRNWPILSFEALLASPEGVLQESCRQLDLPWDPAMVSWPKSVEQIADAKFGNETFIRNREATLLTTLRPNLAGVSTANIPIDDLEWLEREFAEFNVAMNYPAHVPKTAAAPNAASRAIPCFDNTRRCARLARKHRWSRAFRGIGQQISTFVAKSRQQDTAPSSHSVHSELRRTT